MAMVELGEQDPEMVVRRIDIPHVNVTAISKDKAQKPDIEKVIREIKKGRSVTEISIKLGM